MTMCWAFLNHNNFPSYSIKFLSQNFLCRYAPDCTISSPKMQKLPTVGGGDTPLPHPPPLGRFATSGLVASRPRNTLYSVFWFSNVGRYALVFKFAIVTCECQMFLHKLEVCNSIRMLFFFLLQATFLSCVRYSTILYKILCNWCIQCEIKGQVKRSIVHLSCFYDVSERLEMILLRPHWGYSTRPLLFLFCCWLKC